MTESTFPFGTGEEADSAPRSNRKAALVAGAGALAVAVVGYFVVLPMFSGSDSGTPVAVVKHSTTNAKAKTTAKAVTKPKAVTQPASYADVSARQDPFKPLVVAPVAADPAAAPAAPATGGTAAVPPATSGSTGGSSASVGGQRVALVHVYTKNGKQYAQTKVGDKVYSPLVGEVFGGSYKLLATSGKSATYLFGDEQFSLSEGQEVLK
jgi:biotin carboxyl carrier protein